MKLDEVAHKKRTPGQRSDPGPIGQLAAEVERIFKWKTKGLRMGGEYRLEIWIPPIDEDDEDGEDTDFRISILLKKLPSMVSTHIGKDWKALEPRFVAPMMKAVKSSQLSGDKMRHGVTMKIIIV